MKCWSWIWQSQNSWSELGSGSDVKGKFSSHFSEVMPHFVECPALLEISLRFQSKHVSLVFSVLIQVAAETRSWTLAQSGTENGNWFQPILIKTCVLKMLIPQRSIRTQITTLLEQSRRVSFNTLYHNRLIPFLLFSRHKKRWASAAPGRGVSTDFTDAAVPICLPALHHSTSPQGGGRWPPGLAVLPWGTSMSPYREGKGRRKVAARGPPSLGRIEKPPGYKWQFWYSLSLLRCARKSGPVELHQHAWKQIKALAP